MLSSIFRSVSGKSQSCGLLYRPRAQVLINFKLSAAHFSDSKSIVRVKNRAARRLEVDLQANTLTVYVKGIPYSANLKDVSNHFKLCGDVKLVKLINQGELRGYDEENDEYHEDLTPSLSNDEKKEEVKKKEKLRPHSGCAFVTFANDKSLEKSLLLDGTIWPKSELTLFVQRSTQNTLAVRGVRPEGCKTIYVANLPYLIKSEEIFDFFRDAGRIDKIRFPVDEDGYSKGFCHVRFKKTHGAVNAMERNKAILSGRRIFLDYAVDKFNV